MRASELPASPKLTHFLVRGPYSWGRSSDILKAIRAANVTHGSTVLVCRADSEAKCHEIDGSIVAEAHSNVWEGKVWGRDVILKRIVQKEVRGE